MSGSSFAGCSSTARSLIAQNNNFDLRNETWTDHTSCQVGKEHPPCSLHRPASNATSPLPRHHQLPARTLITPLQPFHRSREYEMQHNEPIAPSCRRLLQNLEGFRARS